MAILMKSKSNLVFGGILLGMSGMLLFFGCEQAPNSTMPKFNGHIGGLHLSEFNYDGCQYLFLDRGLSHKGNCTNSIHLYKIENKN